MKQPPLTTVANLHGVSPAAWLADVSHYYVGRRQRGPGGTWLPGWSWPSSPFANPFKRNVPIHTAERKLRAAGLGDAELGEFLRLNDGVERLDQEMAVACYRLWLPTQPKLMDLLPTLKGKVLGCWCAPGACHAQVLAAILNRGRA